MHKITVGEQLSEVIKMALTGEKVGIPEAEEAPVVVMPRWKQPIAGIVSLIFMFIFTYIVWLIIGLSGLAGFVSLIGGFGLMAVLFAIWFENWPFYKFGAPWKVGLAATILNVIVTAVLVVIAIFFAGAYGAYIGIADPVTQYWVGASIFGAISASCFSFGVLWVAGTMYWPWFDKKQPVRGILVFILGWIVTLVVWFLLFFPYGNPTATAADWTTWTVQPYGLNMGWTQWTIFFSLLTLMTFEYWPWNKGGKQPIIGIIAFIGCAVLGFIGMFVAGIFGLVLTYPIFLAFGFADPGLTQATLAAGLWNVAYADWLIVAVIIVALFFDNWPKGFSQTKNILIRLLTVLILGTIFFFGSYYVAPFLSILYLGNPFYDNLTAFLLVMLWVELVFAYLWRKWPIYTAME